MHFKETICNWGVPVLVLIISVTLFLSNYSPKIDRLFYYYHSVDQNIATERHRSVWSFSIQKNICTFIEEQFLPPVSIELVSLFVMQSPMLCIYRRGTLFLDFEKDFVAVDSSPYNPEEQAEILKDSIRSNFHAVFWIFKGQL